jgi:hypothetical protein
MTLCPAFTVDPVRRRKEEGASMWLEWIKLVVLVVVVILLTVWQVAYRRGGFARMFRAAEPARIRWPVSRPLWVRFGLMGVGSRATATNFSRAAAGGAACSFIYAMWKDQPLWGFVMGGLLLVAAVTYRVCIGWVDRRDAWPPVDTGRRT